MPHAAAGVALAFKDRPEEFPKLVLGDLPLGFVPAGLFVQSVEQLLAGRGTGKMCPLKEAAAEHSKITLALSRSVKRHTHTVHQVDNLRCPVCHLIHGRLVV